MIADTSSGIEPTFALVWKKQNILEGQTLNYVNKYFERDAKEYGFYSNVNPDVNHPRWSQRRERRIGEFLKRETLMFNGYGDEVAELYSGMDLKRYF